MAAIGRGDIESIEFPEVDVEVSFRASNAEEFNKYLSELDPRVRGSSRFNLLASCLVYPSKIDDKTGEEVPDVLALSRLVDELPGIPQECIEVIDALAGGEPLDVFEVTDVTRHRLHMISVAVDDAVKRYGKRLRGVILREGHPGEERHMLLKPPSRATYDDHMSAGANDGPEKAYASAIDCLTGIDDAEKRRILAYYPALPTLLSRHIFALGGYGQDRKKARRAG